jgi:hypothetical protein
MSSCRVREEDLQLEFADRRAVEGDLAGNRTGPVDIHLAQAAGEAAGRLGEGRVPEPVGMGSGVGAAPVTRPNFSPSAGQGLALHLKSGVLGLIDGLARKTPSFPSRVAGRWEGSRESEFNASSLTNPNSLNEETRVTTRVFPG